MQFCTKGNHHSDHPRHIPELGGDFKTNFFSHTDCSYLQEEQVDSLAHLLASIHLQMRLREEGVFAANSDYEYYVER